MRLVAIFNIWDDWDMLEYAYKSIQPLVDGVIVVASNESNTGELSLIPEKWLRTKDVFTHEPQSKDPRTSETAKRNYGLNLAKIDEYTHFLTMDADEFYEPEPFLKAKERFLNEPDLAGLVCQCQTYFKSPQLTIGLDTTLVPFIHKLTPTIRHEFNKRYPFAWEGNQIRIDPTRSLNINSGVERTNLIMHHMSHIRKDMGKKIRNSTARRNLERSTILEDYRNAKDGYFCKYYGKTLYSAPNLFGIPEIIDLSV